MHAFVLRNLSAVPDRLGAGRGIVAHSLGMLDIVAIA